MQSSITSDTPKARRRITNFEEREQFAFLALQEIKTRPGITTEQLAEELSLTEDETRSILIRNLKGKGKIINRGWEVVGDSSRTNEPNNLGDSSRTNELPLKDSSRDELTIKWKSAAGTAKTDLKYPWLYAGDRHLIYIGGGSQKNAIAQKRVEQIEFWIKLKLPVDEIMQRVEMLKRGQWRLN